MHERPRPIGALCALLTLLLLVALPAPLAQAQPDGNGAPAESTEAPPPAPAPAPKPDSRFESPRATMNTFYDSARRLSEGKGSSADRAAMIRAMGLAPTQTDKANDYAGALLGVLIRVGFHDAMLDDAEAAASTDTFSFLPHQKPFFRSDQSEVIETASNPKIILTKGDNAEWAFSDDTIAEIESLYDAVADMDRVMAGDEGGLSSALWIERYLPNQLKSEFIGVKLWKWIGLFFIILVGMVLDLIFRSILRATWRRLEKKRRPTAEPIEAKELRKNVRPFGLLVAALVALVALPVLGLPEVALLALMFAARLALTVAAVMAAYRVADVIAFFFQGRAELTDTKIDDLLVPLIRKAAKVFITAIGLVYLADALTIPVLPLLSGLGIGGLAVAFAAKDTIENFFGSISVIVDSPFDVGDWIVVGDVEGTVEELGFRSTRVRTFYNSLVTVPNATLVRANVDNYGRRKYRRYSTHVSIAYDTPPDRIEAFCEGIREIIRSHPYTRKDYFQVWLHKMGAASLDIMLYVFHEAPNWETELRERQRLLLDILRLSHTMGVELAFPTQTLYLRNEEGWAPAQPGESRAESASLREGRTVAVEMMKDAEWRKRKPGPYRFSVAGKEDEETQIESRVGGDG